MAIITQEFEAEDVNSRPAWQYTARPCLKNGGGGIQKEELWYRKGN